MLTGIDFKAISASSGYSFSIFIANAENDDFQNAFNSSLIVSSNHLPSSGHLHVVFKC